MEYVHITKSVVCELHLEAEDLMNSSSMIINLLDWFVESVCASNNDSGLDIQVFVMFGNS